MIFGPVIASITCLALLAPPQASAAPPAEKPAGDTEPATAPDEPTDDAPAESDEPAADDGSTDSSDPAAPTDASEPTETDPPDGTPTGDDPPAGDDAKTQDAAVDAAAASDDAVVTTARADASTAVPPPSAAVPGNARRTTIPSDGRPNDNVRRVLIGGGIAALAVGAGLGAGAIWAVITLDREAELRRYENAQQRQRLAIGLGVPAVVYAATGGVLLILAARDRRKSKARVAPMAGRGFMGATLGGRF